MSTWIPESQRDTRWWIWKKKFLCSIPNLQSMSVEYLQHFGMPVSGNPEYDRQIASELVQRMLTIAEMIEFFNNGVTVRVCNYKDTKEIYERISDHLNTWKQHLEESWHTKGAPIDDLILMDKFAVSVYKHAKYQFTQEIVDSLLAKRMSTMFRVSRQQLMGDGPKPKIINAGEKPEEKEEKKYPERTSMAEIFASHRALINGGAKWK